MKPITQGTTAALTLAVALVGCGGRYNVDEREPHEAGGGGSAATSGSASFGASFVGGGASTTAQAGAPMAGDELGPECGASGAPPPLTGPFAEPGVVWDRISRLTWGRPMGPMPFALPATTTYDWAGDLVTFALLDVKHTSGGSSGLESVLRQWLDFPPDAPLQGSWGSRLLEDEPALHVLLLTPLSEPARLGIFTEPSWLAQNPSISRRGAAMSDALLYPVPTLPDGVEKMLPESDMPDRQALEAATNHTVVCASCHQSVDPLGFALGHFDAKGAYRELDHGQAIDTSGSLFIGSKGFRVEFDDLPDLNRKLAESCAASSGFADAFLRLALVINGVPSQAQSDYVDANRSRVRQAFLNGGRTYEALVKAYIQSPVGLSP